MRLYTTQHQFTSPAASICTRSMYVCILDAAGTIVFHKDLPAAPEHFLRAPRSLPRRRRGRRRMHPSASLRTCLHLVLARRPVLP
jgi:hypothetical protein